MPDPIEAAFQKVIENARANCPRCRADNHFGRLGFWTLPEDTNRHSKVKPSFPHTCRATIDAAAEAMLAAVDSLQFLNVERCFDAKATIHRLLKGESDALR